MNPLWDDNDMLYEPAPPEMTSQEPVETTCPTLDEVVVIDQVVS